jgi:type IV secretory pathway TraG/TraD family ATPase VirD4
VLLPGIGDMKTLEAVSKLAGQVDVPVRSVSRSAWWSGRPSASTTCSWRLQPRLPVDRAYGLPPGHALVLAGARPPRLARLTPWWAYQPFADARRAPVPPVRQPLEAPTVARPLPAPLPPSPLPARTTTSSDLTVKWHKVPGQRPLHPPPPRS